jgi:hypothetical protein
MNEPRTLLEDAYIMACKELLIRPYESEKIDTIIPELVGAQNEFPLVEKDTGGQFGKYADLAGIWDAIKEPLRKHNLFITQYEDLQPDKSTVLVTKVIHISGQWISSRHLLRSKAEYAASGSKQNPDHAYAGQLTYFKRYALIGLLGIFVDDDTVEGKPEPKTRKVEQLLGAELTSLPRHSETTAGDANEEGPTVQEMVDFANKRLKPTDKNEKFLNGFQKRHGTINFTVDTPIEILGPAYDELLASWQEFQKKLGR